MLSTVFQVAVLAAGITFFPLVATGQDGKAGLRALEGTWVVVGIEIGGKKLAVGNGSPDMLTIKDSKLTIWALKKPFAIFKDGELKVDPKKKPMTIDIVLKERGYAVPGIYRLKDAELTMAIPRPSAKGELLVRPQSFESKGTGVMVLTLKRSND